MAAMVYLCRLLLLDNLLYLDLFPLFGAYAIMIMSMWSDVYPSPFPQTRGKTVHFPLIFGKCLLFSYCKYICDTI